jgi:hypothetical protein
MSNAKLLKDLASLCAISATKCVDATFKLGAKPEDPIEAHNWSHQRSRLFNQVRTLDALNIELSAASIGKALVNYSDELKEISDATKDAKKEIRKINEASKLLIKIARVIELGSAILAAAVKPGTDTIEVVLKAGQAVLDPPVKEGKMEKSNLQKVAKR